MKLDKLTESCNHHHTEDTGPFLKSSHAFTATLAPPWSLKVAEPVRPSSPLFPRDPFSGAVLPRARGLSRVATHRLSTEADFAQQGTLGKVWRHFSQLFLTVFTVGRGGVGDVLLACVCPGVRVLLNFLHWTAPTAKTAAGQSASGGWGAATPWWRVSNSGTSCASAVRYFSFLGCAPWCGCATVCLYRPKLKDIWTVSSFWRL